MGETVSPKTFAVDAAEKAGVSARAVQLDVKVGTMPQAVRDAVRDTPVADRTRDLVELARAEPAEQAKLAVAIADGAATVQEAREAVSERPDYDGDAWCTPPDLVAAARQVLGEIDLDPATNPSAQQLIGARRWFTASDDGLSHRWSGTVWLNPPYSQPLLEQFVTKLVDHYDAGHVTAALLLVNNATDTRWFQRLLKRFPACFLLGRVAFLYAGEQRVGARQGQCVFCLGDGVARFRAAFGGRGTIVEAS